MHVIEKCMSPNNAWHLQTMHDVIKQFMMSPNNAWHHQTMHDDIKQCITSSQMIESGSDTFHIWIRNQLFAGHSRNYGERAHHVSWLGRDMELEPLVASCWTCTCMLLLWRYCFKCWCSYIKNWPRQKHVIRPGFLKKIFYESSDSPQNVKFDEVKSSHFFFIPVTRNR